MFKKSALSIEKERILQEMRKAEPGTADYKALLEDLLSLQSVGTYDLSVNNNTVIQAVTSIASLLLVLNYERVHVLTGQASKFLPKFR